MKVQDLARMASTRNEARVVVKMRDVEFNDTATEMTVGDDAFYLDEQATAAVGKYLKIPAPYLKACPAQFRAETLRFWRDQYSEVDTMIESVGGELVGIHSPDLMMVPLESVVEMAERVFSPEDEVRTLLRNQDIFHLDVTSDRYTVDVPNPERIPGRPEQGDITAGGVRFIAYPNRVKAPVVSTYLCRLVCTNGLVTDLKGDQITLKGRTLSEVIDEMECAAESVLGHLDASLKSYAATATTKVPGSPLAFAMALSREYGLKVSVRDAVMDIVNQLPEHASVYDVIQAVTSVANRVSYVTQLQLQQLGGALSFETTRMIERCRTCEQLLVS